MQNCNTNKLVSIIITTHDRSELLPRAIDSALNQTYPNIEIIVVDDGSKDTTDMVINKYVKTYPNVRHIKHEEARGGNAARNSGIIEAKGEFIAGLDDDDEFLPNRISLLVDNYKDKYCLIASRSIQIGKTTRIKTKYLPYVNLNIMLYYNAIGNQVLVKKNIIIESGLFDEDLYRYQDYDMWIRIIAMHGSAKIINNITQIIHYEHDSHSNNKRIKNFKGSFCFYKKHKYLMSKFQRRIHLHRIKKMQMKKIRFIKAKDIIISSFINTACFYEYIIYIIKIFSKSVTKILVICRRIFDIFYE